MKYFIIFLNILFLSSCNNLFLSPSKKMYFDPKNYGFKYEVIKFKGYKDAVLTGMFFPAKRDVKGTIIHFHGNSENMTSHFLYSAQFSDFGYNVFIFDYSGYGASSSKASLYSAIKDGEFAIKHSFKLPNAKKDKIIILGQSLGGAIAIASVSQIKNFNPEAMIIEGSFFSYKEMFNDFIKQRFYLWPFLGIKFFISDKYAPYKYINKIKCPKLFIYSKEDKIVPYTQTLKLYNISENPKYLIGLIYEHISAFSLYKNLMIKETIKFIEEKKL